MAKRGIKSIAELNRQLQEEGVEISHQQLSRVVDNKAQHLSVALLAGLIKVLRCRIDELFSVKST
ncbi:helix-turn-helix domain-containing protein, partial [Escherichia coli]|uniref:helix-turn-helix domain-containing protein n=2 Tax=Pseudomonadota TaxID=1224 RepID=UPI0034A0643B